MTILNTPRSRSLLLQLALPIVSVILILFARLFAPAHAAKQAVLAMDAHVAAESVSNSGLPSTRIPVLVELFTSEGCSSCPPADALLARLDHDQPVPQAEIVVLEEHVDYWEGLGWHDRFSSHQFTDRQSQYAHRLGLDDNYTPQMIVDGNDQFVGNDSARALRSIAKAAATPKLALILTPPSQGDNRITGTISSATANPGQADLYAVLIESAASTNVGSGENGGRTLHHVSVVLSMRRVGSLEALAGKSVPFSLNIPKDSNPANLRIVVFAQRPNQGAVVGAVSSPITNSSARTIAVAKAR